MCGIDIPARSVDRFPIGSGGRRAMSSAIEVRPLRGLRELEGVERLQRVVWGFEPLEVVPRRLLRVMERNGSPVLGAFASEALVGFAFGYLGRRRGRDVLCSHMVGVDPAHRDRGIGLMLKHAQRDWCLANRFDRMIWTFDPLQSRNARFNLHKLGVSSDTYWTNLYGAAGSGLHSGSATDRLLVEWRFDAPSPDREGCRAPYVNAPRPTRAGTVDTTDVDVEVDAPRIRLVVPRDIDAIKRVDAGLVRRWRAETRRGLRHYLRAGFAVVDYDLPGAPRYRSVGSYVLERRDDAKGSAR